MAFCKFIPAKQISYGAKRDYSDIKYIVIHYTGNKGDTAVGNCNYFKNSNNCTAGAHFFIDRAGCIVKSVKVNRTAWSVGGFYTKSNNAAEYYGKCTNKNSVSIELCDLVGKYPSDQQIKAVKKTIRYIQKLCPNAKTIIRHWDVNGKECPANMIGKNSPNWNKFLKAIR